jgi:TolA-binding protein
MSDPVRLLDRGADEFEASLLRAGQADAMSTRSRRQILAGIGIGGLLSASTVATGVRAAAKGWFAKASIGAAGALAIWAGVRATHPTPPEVAVVAPAPVHLAPARPAAAAPADPGVEPPVAPEPVVTAEPAKAVTPPRGPLGEPRESSLTAELASVEQARRAFLAHDYTQSLKLLDEYTRRFPKRQLASEATVLRIEALAARGDRDTAARIGRDFLQNHPNGPYAKRVRSVIGDSAPGTR